MVVNVKHASGNTNIMKNVMTMMQSDHSIFTTSDDKELYYALRRVRNAEIVTAVSQTWWDSIVVYSQAKDPLN